MKRVAWGVMFAAAAVLGVSFMGCDKKIENSELKKEDVKGTATIELVLGAKLSDEVDASFEAVPAGAKVIVATTEKELFGNDSDNVIVISEKELSGKHMTLTVPVSNNGTNYKLIFTASNPADYSKAGDADKYYYELGGPAPSVELFPGAKEVVVVEYEAADPAEL